MLNEHLWDAVARLEDAVDAYKQFRDYGEIDEHYESTMLDLRIDMEVASARLDIIQKNCFNQATREHFHKRSHKS